MAFTLPDGKVARTLTEQVKFLTEKLKDLYAAVNNMGITIVKVDTLPDEGEPRTIYLVPVVSPDQDNYYEEYIWYDDAWELIGTTQIDLSGYVTLDTEQTITAKKTIAAAVDIKEDAGDTFAATISYDNDNTQLNVYGGIAFVPQGIKTGELLPYVNASYNLGSASYVWNYLYTNNISNGTGTLTCHCDFKPSANNALDLGVNGVAWKDFYLSGKVYSSVFVVNNGSTDVFKVDGVNGEIKSNYTIQPTTNGGANLGKSTAQWNNLYLSGVAYSNTLQATANADVKIKAYNGTDIVSMSDSSARWNVNVLPAYNGSQTLGLNSDAYRWAGLYLKPSTGFISNGTDSVLIDDLAALITYAKAQGWIS